MSKEKQAIHFFKSQREAILSTHSKELPGYPFGSLTPFCSLPDSSIVILISHIAQHTQNIKLNAKVCLTTSDHLEHIQSGRRLSYIGDAALVENESEYVKISERYLRFFPEAQSYFQTHDFYFYRIEPVRIRHIGGFGQIFWIEKETWLKPSAIWLENEKEAIDHMNQDHQSFLLKLIQNKNQDGKSVENPEVIAIDYDGFYMKMKANGRLQQHFIEFTEPVLKSSDLRHAFKLLSQQIDSQRN